MFDKAKYVVFRIILELSTDKTEEYSTSRNKIQINARSIGEGNAYFEVTLMIKCISW